ncbi:esterase-like activity of phytase family protein [Microbacterium sp. cx-55]|uniref:esterase-like activity of phytase family protein n=1 Tax=Microbacterium sp. cx-55 TaxID=2875948 RepID=UPI001CBAF82F|nr:esterase-like activity of phytase family protein [Microbacterium sp. cx-55]MBZ4487144.1 esterase-like activity of phytase family protein [Microbacterium sp. cx-55]UGB36758.1 esterase-like activity of phytase family protein [Microbacterium sp. cx-55]
MDDDGFTSEGLQVSSVTTLRDANGAEFDRRTVDPESIRVDPDGGVLWTTEGATSAGIPPALWVSGADGTVTGSIPLPGAFVPQVVDGRVITGSRDNKSLESLAVSPDQTIVTTAVENSLVQDGPAASLNTSSPSRVVRFDRSTGQDVGQYVYRVDPVEDAPTEPLPAPINTYSADRGLSELVALNSTDYLAVERSFASGVGYRIKVYWTSILGATDVRATAQLAGDEKVMPKRLIFDFASTDVTPDNVEGITWGPTLTNGDRTLVLSVDDNFGFLGSNTSFHLLRVPSGALPMKSLDINADGEADVRDLARALFTQAGDIDGDGKRGIKDLALWRTYFETIARSTSVAR